MRFYCDEDSGLLTTSPGVKETLREAVFRRGDTRSIEIQFFQNGTIISRPPGSTGKFSLKVKGDYSGDALVESLSWTKLGDGATTYYRFTPDFGSPDLTNAIEATGKGYIDLMLEFEWSDGESIGSTLPNGKEEVVARIWNDINKTGTVTPTPGPDPYPTSEKLILHYDGVTGWTGMDGLEAIPTVAMPTNRLIAFVIDGKTFFAKLIEGDYATSVSGNPIYVQPLDHDDTSNNRVWVSFDAPEPDLQFVHYDPAISTVSTQAAITTVGIPTGYAAFVQSLGTYVLTVGNAETFGSMVIKPDDYDAGSNARVWVREIDSCESLIGTFALMGGESGDLDSVPTFFMDEFQVIEIAGAMTPVKYRLEEKDFTSIAVLSVSADSIFTSGALPKVNQVIEFQTTGVLPGGLSVNEFRYVVSVNEGNNSFKTSDTHGGVASSITSAGTGSHQFFIHEDPWWVRPRDYSVYAWRLIGDETILTLPVFSRGDSIQTGRHYAGFAPFSMLPNRVQFDLSANGGSSVSVGVESDQVEVIDSGNVSFASRSANTVALGSAVTGRIFIGDELIVDVSASGGAKGLLVHISGIVAPLLGASIGNASQDSELSALVAVAGSDQSVLEGTIVTLDSSGSTANTGAITYAWSQVSGPSVTISNPTGPQPTFTAPQVATDTAFVFRLTVSNSDTLQESTDNVTVTVSDVGLVAAAGTDQSVNIGATVTLVSTGSTPITPGLVAYEWEQIWGPPVTLSNAAVASPTFVAPASPQSYSFRLHVRNTMSNAVATDDVAIAVADPNAYQFFATDSTPTSVDSGAGRVIVGMETGDIYTSSDLLEWFKISTGIGANINDIAIRDDGRAVIATDGGLYSSRNGLVWTEVMDPYAGVDWKSVSDSGTTFVAVSNTGGYARSTDGVTWTTGVIKASTSMNGVTNDAGSKFLALGADGYIGYSTNSGASWGYVDVGSPTNTGAAYSPTLSLWAVSSGSGVGTFPDANFGSGIVGALTNRISGAFYDVAWDSVNQCFLAVGFGVARKSYDGITWTSVYADIGSPGTCQRVASLAGRFVLPSATLDGILVTQPFPE